MTNLEKIIDKATDILGDEARALDWIDHTSATLGGTPRELSATDEGTNAVMIHLAGISRHTLD
jgi:uncharacterized protein (DUF2384 family)